MTEEEIDNWLGKWLKSELSMANFLALAHANGLRFPDVLELHRWMLAEKCNEYIKTWSSAGQPEEYEALRDGGYYAISHMKHAEWECPYHA